MSKELATKVTAYLQAQPDIIEAMPMLVTLGKRELYGAIYRSKTWGTRYYLVGDLPNEYKRSSNIVYKCSIGGQEKKWFVAGFYNAKYLASRGQTPADPSIQPFGDNFMLAEFEPCMEDNKPREYPMTAFPL